MRLLDVSPTVPISQFSTNLFDGLGNGHSFARAGWAEHQVGHGLRRAGHNVLHSLPLLGIFL